MPAPAEFRLDGGSTLAWAIPSSRRALPQPHSPETPARIGEGASSASRAAERGESLLPRFTQTTASPTFRHGPFAGQSIGDVATGLRAGQISSSQLPVDVITRDGNPLGLNTRSMLALRRANISPADWSMVDRTGQPAYEQLLDERLARNGLTNAGTDVLRITGAGPGASWLG